MSKPTDIEITLSKEQAKKLNLLFRMVDLNITEDNCWLIEEVLKQYSEKKGNFSINDAAKLIVKKEQIFK